MFEMCFFFFFPLNFHRENSITSDWVIEKGRVKSLGVAEDKLLTRCPFGIIRSGRRIYPRHTRKEISSLIGVWVVIADVEVLHMWLLLM